MAAKLLLALGVLAVAGAVLALIGGAEVAAVTPFAVVAVAAAAGAQALRDRRG